MKPKTNKEKLIELYEECSKTGKLPEIGLCCSLRNYLQISTNKLLLFYPDKEDFDKIDSKGESWVFWASGLKTENENKFREFTPLRQTILAFLIAMEEN